jgi:hypothetical protein
MASVRFLAHPGGEPDGGGGYSNAIRRDTDITLDECSLFLRGEEASSVL